MRSPPLSTMQTAAYDAVQRWLRAPEQPFFYLAGYAGTGKTTVANALTAGRRTVFGAYTGKAAEVMARRGCTGATTIHRLIYRPKGFGTDGRAAELRTEIERLSRMDPVPRGQIARAIEELNARKTSAGGFGFELDRDNPIITEADMIVVDEVSMVSEDMFRDLVSFGKPILVLGDPAQLPPVGAPGFFTHRQPDFMLTEIHRQAAESGVLQLATMVREGRWPRAGRYGTSVVASASDVRADPATMRAADQILCGYNKTRTALNGAMRGKAAPVLPVAGDKLVCLRNNHDRGFFNGSTMIALEDGWDAPGAGGRMRSHVIVEKDGVEETVEIDRAAIAGAGAGDNFDLIALDYAWALTCHKAQGSQWDRVLVIEESDVAREHARAWAYTAITRAAEQVVIALPN